MLRRVFERRCADPSVREAGKYASETLSPQPQPSKRKDNRNVTLTLTTVRSSCYYIGIRLASIKYSKGSWLGPEVGWGEEGAPKL